ncbi:MAG: thioredoxin [Candidatus Sungbacteria bacterium]|nr:thioredoxin [Candidatus Sungbacteria bacterium]
MAKGTLDVTDATFEAEVLKAKGGVIVDFWAPWCAPCVAFAPKFDELAKEAPSVKFCKLDVDKSPGIAREYEVRTIPTVMIFKDGEAIWRAIGTVEKAKLLLSMLAA